MKNERPSEELNRRNAAFDNKLRPEQFADFVGQRKIRDRLELAVEAAKDRGETLDHVLFSGPPGLGKTTLSYILGDAMGPQQSTSWSRSTCFIRRARHSSCALPSWKP